MSSYRVVHIQVASVRRISGGGAQRVGESAPRGTGLISFTHGICFPRSSYRSVGLFLLTVMWNPASDHFAWESSRAPACLRAGSTSVVFAPPFRNHLSSITVRSQILEPKSLWITRGNGMLITRESIKPRLVYRTWRTSAKKFLSSSSCINRLPLIEVSLVFFIETNRSCIEFSSFHL